MSVQCYSVWENNCTFSSLLVKSGIYRLFIYIFYRYLGPRLTGSTVTTNFQYTYSYVFTKFLNPLWFKNNHCKQQVYSMSSYNNELNTKSLLFRQKTAGKQDVQEEVRQYNYKHASQSEIQKEFSKVGVSFWGHISPIFWLRSTIFKWNVISKRAPKSIMKKLQYLIGSLLGCKYYQVPKLSCICHCKKWQIAYSNR